MKVVNLDYHNLITNDEPISICLGYFDGMHPGHVKIIKEAMLNSPYPIAVLTFNEPIAKYIDNGKVTRVLTTPEDRYRFLSRFNIDYLYVLSIDRDFINLSPESFIEKILKPLNIKKAFVGEDYRFGNKKEGDIYLLKKYFDTRVVPLEKVDETKISTSDIVSLIQDGNIKKATQLLGRPYEIKGKVIEGNHIGETIGFRTMNIDLSGDYVIPKYGVYKVLVYVHGIPRLGIANVGVHPSIKARKSPLLEVHIFDYDELMYDHTVYVSFIDFIREEKKFASLDELKQQIEKDIDLVKNS